ncbi:hypothetical protein AWRI1631_30140 [Saccharomyces cerevisiae AWRI1631]|uniref:Uncharacterized protein n=1 Tax=Saccharomyces cerevisiae (strain AWRI1631) TaxID=545124 RepID=B5VEQ6_YEAS6|nr:hypothetical protein AWRI1631_30140 [Saccharomyces cerevisiae AWRI1631]
MFICILCSSFCFISFFLLLSRLTFRRCFSCKPCKSFSICSSSVNGTTSISVLASSLTSMPKISLAIFLHLRIILKSFLPKTFKSSIQERNSSVVCFNFFKIFHSWSFSSIVNLFISPSMLIGSSVLTKSKIEVS